MRHLRQHAAGYLLLIASILSVVAALAHVPAHGLWAYRYANVRMKGEPPEPILDRRLHFASDDALHRVPSFIGEHSSVRWTGYLEFPRSGYYLFRFTTDDGGRFFVDGNLVVDNSGFHNARAVENERWFDRGLHVVRIDYWQGPGSAAMKLEWRLPASYNVAGLVPRSAFWPEPPPQPQLLDDLLRLAPWLFGLASLLAFTRERIARRLRLVRDDRPVRVAILTGCGLFIVALGYRLWDLGGAGETCDEWAYTAAARIYADNIATLNFDPEQWRMNREHPSVGKLFYGVVMTLFGDTLTAARAGSAVLNALTVVMTYAIGLRLFGLGAATMAGLLLSFMPTVVAHGKVAALDSPSSFMFTAAVFLFLKGTLEPSKRLGVFVWLTLVAGLALATKFSNGLLLPFFFVGLVLFNMRALRRTGIIPTPLPLLLLPVLIFMPMLVLWPWLWGDPLAHFLDTLSHWNYVPPEPFLGADQAVAPVYYFVVYFLGTTPVALLAFAFVAALQLLRRTPAPIGPATEEFGHRDVWAFLLLWFIVPFGWSVTSFRQDGIRYIYPCFPPFALLCGGGVALVASGLTMPLVRRGFARAHRLVMPAVTSLVAAYVLSTALRVHPYYLDYFNEFTGGAGSVFARNLFEVGWWGEGMDRMVSWMNDNAPQDASWDYEGLVQHTLDGMRSDLRRRGGRPDYLLRANLRHGGTQIDGYAEVFAVRVDGAPLAMVFQRIGPETVPAPNSPGRASSPPSPPDPLDYVPWPLAELPGPEVAEPDPGPP